jgi:hypothetical protein
MAKKIWLPYDDSKMVTKNGFDPLAMTKIIVGRPMATQFIHYCRMATKFSCH